MSSFMPVKVSSAILKEIEDITGFREKIEKSLQSPITELLEIILGGGIALRSSDLHFEPQKKEIRIRLRIDGILQEVLSFDFKIYENLLSRIKFLSKIKLNITDRPQAGRFTILAGSSEKSLAKQSIEIRTSTLPTEYGESIVLRILDPERVIELENLGLRKDLLSLFEKEIKKPNGMIIITGPTGSGKTTTLYAFLKKIQRPGIKIITIEDPIEYHLEGISQTQTNPAKGYDFVSGLKSIMRQDPDVILVGEIRDVQTSEIAIQAALTGHLVFTTLHTNDATGTIARLASLGTNPVNIGPAINLAIAQRLVRKMCKKCGEFKKATPSELKKIREGLKNIPKEIELPKIWDGIKTPKVKGCKYCNFTGYRDRTGIFEAFLIDDEIEKFILTNPLVATLRKKVIERGMLTIKQDGLIKVLEGLTTLEEVERIAGE